MKNSHRMFAKVLTLCMALVLVLGMTSSAMAVGATGTYNLTKYLTMKTNASVPPVTFGFAVTHDATCKQDADMANNVPQIMEGLGTPVIQDITFNAGDTNTSTTAADGDTSKTPDLTGITDADIAGGKYIKDTGAITFNGIDFLEPGIYRYIITESIKTGDTSGSITLDTPATRFMDVYVTNNADYSALQVESVIIHEANTNTTNGDGVTEKDTGFINKYVTYDLSLEKQVTGNQGFRSKLFKFTVDIANAAPGTQYIVTGATGNTGSTGGTTISIPTTGTTATAVYYLKHGDKITIQGLTATTTYTITEDVPDSDGYTVSRTITGGTPVGTDTKTTGIVTMGDSDDAVVFENNRQGVVPTGILLDIWPSILIVAVAAVALIVLLRNKKKRATRY